MKTYTLLLLLLIFGSTHVAAQAPQGIPYQAAARNANGNIMANQAINVRFTIHDSTANGTAVYKETHNITTNAQGMFSLNMGLGTPTTGSFNQINWGNNAKFMQVELSTNGGTNYTDMGTQQLMSVPYALYAGSAGSIKRDTNNIFNKHGYLNLLNDTFIVTNKEVHMEIELISGNGGFSGGATYGYTSGYYGYTQTYNPYIGGKGYKVKLLINLIEGDTLYIKVGKNGLNGCSYCVGYPNCYSWNSNFNIFGGQNGMNGENSIISLNDSSFTNFILKVTGGSGGSAMYYQNSNCSWQGGQVGGDGYLVFGNSFLSSSATIVDEGVNSNGIIGVTVRW